MKIVCCDAGLLGSFPASDTDLEGYVHIVPVEFCILRFRPPSICQVRAMEKTATLPATDEPHSLPMLPENDANWFSKLFVIWMDRIFYKGYKQSLERQDMYTISNRFEVKPLADEFAAIWASESERQRTDPKHSLNNSGEKSFWKRIIPSNPLPPKDEPSLARALWKQWARRAWFVGMWKLLADTANLTTPLLLAQIVSFVEQSVSAPEPPPLHMGFVYVVILFVLQGLAAIAQNRFFVNANGYGMSVRATMTATIYRKALRLSSLSRQDYNAGRVTNMISSDTQRLEMFVTNCHMLWTAPVMLLGIFIVLLVQLGPPAIAGFCLLIALTPVQEKMWKKLGAIRKQSAGITDQRVRATQEILSGIRIIKFFAWEQPFMDRIMKLRHSEMNQIIKASVTRAGLQSIAFSFPVISAAISFVIYGLTAPRLDPAKIFAAVSLFNMMRFPLMFFPLVIAAWADSAVAIKRITGLLLAQEIENQPVTDPNAPDAVRVDNANFIWDSDPPEVIAKRQQDHDALFKKSGGGGRIARLLGDPARRQKRAPNGNGTSSELGQPDPVLNGVADPGDQKKWRRRRGVSKPSENMGRGVSQMLSLPDTFTLQNIDLTIPRGQLVVVVGSVGSGKSSLLNALIGECKRISGNVVFGGSVGYASQQAWIQNATVRDNILFGQPYDRERYYRTLHTCALEKDISVLPQGDMTEIGERGINLSGGQKARVALARLLYFGSDIILMDDPLSAVDAHVGRFLFENCILGALKDKTRILVTHQLHFLHKADYVIVMKDGKIAERGNFHELMSSHGEFSALMTSYGGVDATTEISVPGTGEFRVHELDEKKIEDQQSEVSQKQLTLSGKNTLERISKQIKVNSENGPVALMMAEDRAVGAVSGAVYWAYTKHAGGWTFLCSLAVIIILVQASSVGNNFWLTIWTQNQIPQLGDRGYVGIYLMFGVVQSLMLFVFSSFMAVIGNRAARGLHIGSIQKVLFAPVAFFDTTPLGRIVNRFARDQDQIDTQLVDSLRMFISTFSAAVSTFVLIIYATPIFAAPLVPILGLYWLIQAVYRRTARELKRLDSITRSPLYAYVGESLNGISTIRAYREENTFINHNDFLIDANNSPYYMTICAQYWLNIRLNMLGNLILFFAGLFAVLDRYRVAAAIIGLSLSYAQQITQTLSWCVQQASQVEIQMNSVERVHYYSTFLETEAAPINETHRPPQDWPDKGDISIKDLQMKYSEKGPLILKDISLEVKSTEKIGIVGRTGSGKSSLMQAIFRMVEPVGGSIIIDGEDCLTLGLNDLRSRLAIIPQDPTLFSGTIRYNLDPFAQHSDSDLWDALARASLKDKVAEMDGKLEASVTEGGENLSVGQRQLLCLARAMLRRPKVLVLDEVTSNIDYETDATVQRVLREDFQQTTILTIAHRLNTIIDYDKILVLDQGRIVEYDTPANLLSREGTAFGALVDETGATNSKLLRELALLPLATRRRSVISQVLPEVAING
ncbi:hypothetical protein SeLEV6574_g06782 [Synchytrium endobioticum]|uniref:Uncharacterized protein n=1 Tax=Synchytrium endobioticum TaxID=286115 RepID=A0A507CKJ5_9FUNG|nr:hypothetical protein SeLEV6574_g06782 [Synchytrium endobioticum]